MNLKTMCFIFIFLFTISSAVNAKIYVKKESPYSIYPEYQYIDGQVQKHFNRCNPCYFTIIIQHEEKFYKEIIFDFSVSSFSSIVGRNNVCVPIEDKTHYIDRIGYKQEWELVNSMWSVFCQLYGYQDICFMDVGKWCAGYPTHECGYYGGKSCVGNQVCCFNYVSETSSWIEMRYDETTLARFENGDSVLHKEVNLAKFVNDACYDSIVACRDYEMCDNECSVTFAVYSENRGGSFDISDTPIRLAEQLPTIPTCTDPTTCLPPKTTWEKIKPVSIGIIILAATIPLIIVFKK